MPERLTDVTIRAAVANPPVAGQRDFPDGATPGLRLRVGKSGKAVWTLNCRDQAGRMRRFSIGIYPDLGLKDARAQARRLRISVADGSDPILDRKRERKRAAGALVGVGTIQGLLDAYAAAKGARLKSWAAGRRTIERVFEDELKTPMPKLTRTVLQLCADAYSAKHQASLGVRCLRPALKWGAQRDFCALELSLLQQPTPTSRRSRTLNRAELGAVVASLRIADDPYSRAMEFMLLTLARREEVARARWCDIDLAKLEWRIPETKNGKVHIVPLSAQALALLGEAPKELSDSLVFRTVAGKGGELSRLVNWDRATKLIQEDCGVSGWHRHDLRRTGATILGDLGFAPHVIEAALNHTSIHSQLAATYNRSRYLPEVREAQAALADYVDQAVGAMEQRLAAV